jgi:integrase/recombinase XerD
MDTRKRHGNNLQRINFKAKKTFSKIDEWQEAFIADRKVQAVKPGTVEIYHRGFRFLNEFSEINQIQYIEEIDANMLRRFLAWLEDKKKLTPGGRHQIYRVIRTYIYFWEMETEPLIWSNPFKRVKAPRLNEELLDPVNMDDLHRMLKTCDNDFYGTRDKAIFYTLLDTGLRASELLSLHVDNLDIIKGQIELKIGKMGKGRIVFVSQKTRKAIRNYMTLREAHFNNRSPSLFISDMGEELGYFGLRMIMTHRAQKAGVKKPPSIHSFRRRFALTCLENGMNVFTLQRLMGHADLQVMKRYLKQTPGSMKDDFEASSPVESLL